MKAILGGVLLLGLSIFTMGADKCVDKQTPEMVGGTLRCSISSAYTKEDGQTWIGKCTVTKDEKIVWSKWVAAFKGKDGFLKTAKVIKLTMDCIEGKAK